MMGAQAVDEASQALASIDLTGDSSSDAEDELHVVVAEEQNKENRAAAAAAASAVAASTAYAASSSQVLQQDGSAALGADALVLTGMGFTPSQAAEALTRHPANKQAALMW
jgi:hypothetical protein